MDHPATMQTWTLAIQAELSTLALE